jgi:hypothetical protein
MKFLLIIMVAGGQVSFGQDGDALVRSSGGECSRILTVATAATPDNFLTL